MEKKSTQMTVEDVIVISPFEILITNKQKGISSS